MRTMSGPLEEIRTYVRDEIARNAFITKDSRELLSPGGADFSWFLDFKGVVLKPGMLDGLATLFWDHLKARELFQIGGLETAAIALVSAIVMKAQPERALNSFYVRKSRKVDGMQRMIEGTLTDEPVVLVDDGLNSGRSIVRQVEALKQAGKRVEEVCVIVAFRDPSYYEYFNKNGITIWSIFTLEDFPDTGGMLKDTLRGDNSPPRTPFRVGWKFSSEDPQYFHVLPKSAPIVDTERVYFGADNGTMWALNQSDGSVAWSHRVLFGAGRKKIFSSPALYDGTLYFGAYDGNFYALDAKTGAKKWVYMDADWIGSSPCVAEDLNVVFVGLEFGLWHKQGGIAALDAKTGEKKWWRSIGTLVHSSPAYSQKYNVVVIGSESGEVYALDAKTGALRWTYVSDGPVKAGFAFDDARGLVAFGSWDDHIHVVNIKTGARIHAIHTHKPLYSSPIIENGRLCMGLLDKRIVCIDLDSGKMLWEFWTHSRVFATPIIIDGSLYCGSNDGRLYELDPETGKEKSYFQVTERIVNKIAYNPATKHFFLPTYANELYCLARKDG